MWWWMLSRLIVLIICYTNTKSLCYPPEKIKWNKNICHMLYISDMHWIFLDVYTVNKEISLSKPRKTGWSGVLEGFILTVCEFESYVIHTMHVLSTKNAFLKQTEIKGIRPLTLKHKGQYKKSISLSWKSCFNSWSRHLPGCGFNPQ